VNHEQLQRHHQLSRAELCTYLVQAGLDPSGVTFTEDECQKLHRALRTHYKQLCLLHGLEWVSDASKFHWHEPDGKQMQFAKFGEFLEAMRQREAQRRDQSNYP
jgi:hypothetical protein